MPCLAQACAADLKSSETSPQLVPGSNTQHDKMKSSPVLFIGHSCGSGAESWVVSGAELRVKRKYRVPPCFPTTMLLVNAMIYLFALLSSLLTAIPSDLQIEYWWLMRCTCSSEEHYCSLLPLGSLEVCWGQRSRKPFCTEQPNLRGCSPVVALDNVWPMRSQQALNLKSLCSHSMCFKKL